MRRLAPLVAVALLAAACTEPLPESDDWSPATIDADVVLWRLAAGPAGFVGVGGPVTPEDLEDATRPLSMAAYRSGDGATWEETFAFGTTTGPVFGLAASAERYVVAGVWSDGPAVYLSADGAEWSRVALPVPSAETPDMEAAGIADDGETVVVFGFTSEPTRPVAWAIGGTRPAELVDAAMLQPNFRLSAAAAGPGGFVAALRADSDDGTVPSHLWRSPDGIAWEPVVADFPEQSEVTGLIGGETGYVALVGRDGDQEDFTVWSSPDGADWRQRADDDTVFDLLEGNSGILYEAITSAPAAEGSGTRPIAFSFGGYWLEIPAAYEGERFLSVAVAAEGQRRVVSGISGSGSDLRPHVLVADP